jgi:hypothetical protein
MKNAKKLHFHPTKIGRAPIKTHKNRTNIHSKAKKRLFQTVSVAQQTKPKVEKS